MMLKEILLLLYMIFTVSTASAQNAKSYNWEQGECGRRTNIAGDYECFIFVWGKEDSGNVGLLQLVQKVEGGVFFIYLSQTLMKKDLALSEGELKSKYSFTVDERIPLNFTSANAVVTFDNEYPIVHVKTPVTENIFTYLENGKKTITIRYEKSDGTQGYSKFKMDSYIEQLALMTLKIQSLTR